MLDLDRDVDSLSNFKRNTPEFLRQLKESGNPVFLGIRRGIEDVRAGRTQPIAEAIEDIRRELNLPRGS